MQIKRPWSAFEDDVIRENYRGGTWKACAPYLPHRTPDTIRKRAVLLGVATRNFWTSSEDKRLAILWDLGIGMAIIAAELKRNETQVYRRAKRLGLEVGCPPGFEFLFASVRRTGFSNTSDLRRVLRWARVIIHTTRSDPRKRGMKRRHYVDPIAVDEAIARWMKTETVKGAAEARGLVDVTLREWLLKAGEIQHRPNRCDLTHRRISSSVIDRVVAARRRAA